MTSRDDLVRSPLFNDILHPRRGDFVIVEWTADPSASDAEREYIAPIHVHHEGDEAWYVLEGKLGFLLDGEEIEVAAGGAAYARAGVTHTYWNASNDSTRYLLIMSPRIHELIGALHDPNRREQSMEETFREFRSELFDAS